MPHLLIISLWGWGFHTWIWARHKHLVHTHSQLLNVLMAKCSKMQPSPDIALSSRDEPIIGWPVAKIWLMTEQKVPHYLSQFKMHFKGHLSFRFHVGSAEDSAASIKQNSCILCLILSSLLLYRCLSFQSIYKKKFLYAILHKKFLFLRNPI
jgi:hypothetical protein